MQDIQEIFNRIKQTKVEQKAIRDAYKCELDNHAGYKEVKDEYETARAKKKEIENSIKMAMDSDFEKLDKLKNDIAADNIMITDIAYNKLMKGESIEIQDEFGNKYTPVFVVKFEKS